MSELLHLRDACPRAFDATVVAVRDGAVALDHTAFYATGGGQPHDTGVLDGRAVREVRHGDDGLVWHSLDTTGLEVAEVRVVDIVGLDEQADGGTHVGRTDEVGRIRVVKTESKGKGNKRIRIEVLDA